MVNMTLISLPMELWFDGLPPSSNKSHVNTYLRQQDRSGIIEGGEVCVRAKSGTEVSGGVSRTPKHPFLPYVYGQLNPVSLVQLFIFFKVFKVVSFLC